MRDRLQDMIEVPSDPSQLILVGEFPFYSPRDLFDSFTIPDLVVAWWPTVAVIEPGVGGRYEFVWPDQQWTLLGTYTAFEPGAHLGFTWRWNHGREEARPLQVDIFYIETEDGSRMSIHHGPFVGEDLKERDGIREGWIHFSMLLAGLRREAPQD